MSRKLPFKPRKTQTEIPLNWLPTTLRGDREYRCSHYEMCIFHGEVRRCSHCCRKQYIKNHRNRHVFKIHQADDPEFDKKVLERFPNPTFSSINRKYLTSLATLCGEIDLSFKKASSESLRTFAIHCAELGIEIAAHKNTNFSVGQILQRVSEKDIKSAVLHVAETTFDKKCQEFREHKYTSLLCDAGTVLKLHCLHFFIARFHTPIEKLLLQTFDVDNGDSGFYHDCFYRVLQNCDESNIFISSVTFDKLPAQMLGFKQLQSTTNDPFVQAILIIPCFGHMTNNVFLELTKTNEEFKALIEQVLKTAHFIRTNSAVKFLTNKCPTISTTRWLYIVDVLLFLIHHKDNINTYIEIEHQMNHPTCPKVDEDFEFLYNLLIWLKSFSLVLEKDGLQFFNVVPLAREFFNELNKLYRSYQNETYQMIIESLDSIMRIRLLKNAYMETITSYVLSCKGRQEIRKHYKGVRVENPQAENEVGSFLTFAAEKAKFEFRLKHSQDIIFPEDAELEEEEIDEPEEHIDKEGKEGQEKHIDNEIDDAEIDEILTKQANAIDENDKQMIESDNYQQAMIENVLNTPYEDRVRSDFYTDIYQSASTELRRLAEILHIDTEKIQDQLDLFLFADPTTLSFMRHSNLPPNSFWRHVYSAGMQWEPFTDLALRYSSVFVTETIVERAFSQQHYIQHERMTNISSPVMKARLQIHVNSKTAHDNP